MTKTIKEPLVKISKRQNLALGYKLLLTVGAILLSLVLGAILLSCLGYNPISFYVQMLMGNFKNASYLKLMVRALIHLLITSLGVSLAFKMRFWNIGAEGQFIVGALIAMTFSLLIGDSLPSPLGAIIIVLLGTLGGGLYALFVAALKVKFNTNETLMTLMLNYVALYIASYTLKTDFYAVQGQGVPAFRIIAESLWLTEIDIGKFSFDTALFVAVALVLIIFVYFKQSKHGYELNVVGDSPNTAKYAGMKVKWIIVRTMFLSGAIIGMAGALKLCGSSAGHTFSANITGGVGWTSIIVAWLAKLNPIGIFIASLLMSILERGCSFARTSLGISEAMSDVLQGIILFTVLASDFFINYKVSFRKKVKAAVSTPEGDASLTEETKTDESCENAEADALRITAGESEEALLSPVNAVTVAEETVSDGQSTGATDETAAETPPNGPDTYENAEKEADKLPAPEKDETPADENAVELNENAPDKQEIKDATDENTAHEAKAKQKPASKKRATTAKKQPADKSGEKPTKAKKPAAKKTAAEKPAAKTTATKSKTTKKPAATAVKSTKTTAASKTDKSAAKTSAQIKKNGKGGNNNE